jgi:hypothetical protein
MEGKREGGKVIKGPWKTRPAEAVHAGPEAPFAKATRLVHMLVMQLKDAPHAYRVIRREVAARRQILFDQNRHIDPLAVINNSDETEWSKHPEHYHAVVEELLERFLRRELPGQDAIPIGLGDLLTAYNAKLNELHSQETS